MMQWEDHKTYSLSAHYDVVENAPSCTWTVVRKDLDTYDLFPTHQTVAQGFDTRKDAKHFAEIHWSVGA